jgi:hypothetical protein
MRANSWSSCMQNLKFDTKTVLSPLKTLSCKPIGILQVLTLNSISRNEIWNVLKWMNNISLIQIDIRIREKSEKLL